MRAYRSMIVFSAPIAVDTFFVLSGLLVSFNLFMLRKRYNQDKPEKNSQIELIILFKSKFSEVENWIFSHCISIDFYELRHFSVQPYCFQCHCCAFWQTAPFGRFTLILRAERVIDTGGHRCFLCRIMSTQPTLWVHLYCAGIIWFWKMQLINHK